MRRGLVLAMVAACGAKPHRAAEPVDTESTIAAPLDYALPRVKAERPTFAIAELVPDFHHELRWPLPPMSHPELEPKFPIARELAIDVGWEELCARGIHRRVVAAKAEQLAYLRGWCSALDGDIDAACRHLKPLLHSTLKGMAEAVRLDLANILVSTNADSAEGYIQRNVIRDVRVLDLLAASYAEMGRSDDAFVINRLAIDADSVASMATKCRRLVKHIVLAPERSQRAIEELRKYVPKDKADPICRELAETVGCWHEPGEACRWFISRNNIHPRAKEVLEVYAAWPDVGHYVEWWSIGERLGYLLEVPGAADLALAAFEASLEANSLCAGRRALHVNAAVDKIRAMPAYEAHAPRLEKLERACRPPTVTIPAAQPAPPSPVP